jgi:type II secretory pathway component GspD/PulD (secretin)
MQNRLPYLHTPISRFFLCGMLLSATCGGRALAQNPAKDPDPTPRMIKTFYLNSGSSSVTSDEILTAVRLLLEPRTKLYLMPSDNSISINGSPEQIDLATKLIADLDRPKKDYRLTYTMTEMDGSKRIGVQHSTLTMMAGGHTQLKQGSKVPVATGTMPLSALQGNTTQITFIDVGINVDATLTEAADGVKLQSKVENSGLLEDRSVAGMQEPIIRQMILEGTTLLQPGKPVVLGSVDVPGSTRHLDVEVLLEPMR